MSEESLQNNSQRPEAAPKPDAPPKPLVEKMLWPFPFIWLVPIAAAIVAGYYVYQAHKEHGPEITVEFADASGVRVGETPVQMRGAQIGQVVGVEISPDHNHARVKIRLTSEDRSIVKQGAQFWIVKPDFSQEDFSGLSTIVSGPYIDALPGDGTTQTYFTGMERSPVMLGQGIRIILHIGQLDKLGVGSEVLYRGVQAGVVQDIRLSSDSRQVNVTLFIWQRFTPLVRTNSKFWIVNGTDIKGGILSSVHVKLGSIRTLTSGSIAFATPDDIGPIAGEGSDFPLYADAKDDWLKWAPHVDLPPESVGTVPKEPQLEDDAKQP